MTTRMFCLAASTASAASSIDGAMTASMNVDVSASRGRRRPSAGSSPTMPPNAESGSASRARTYAASIVAAGRHAARIRVLDHDRGRLGEFERDPQRRVEIEQVRVGQLLPLMHLPGAAGIRRELNPRRALMRILAISKRTRTAVRRAGRARRCSRATSRRPPRRRAPSSSQSCRRTDRYA